MHVRVKNVAQALETSLSGPAQRLGSSQARPTVRTYQTNNTETPARGNALKAQRNQTSISPSRRSPHYLGAIVHEVERRDHLQSSHKMSSIGGNTPCV